MTELEDRGLSVNEIGKHFGVGHESVYCQADKHSILARLVGRFGMFKNDDINEWVLSGGANDGDNAND